MTFYKVEKYFLWKKERVDSAGYRTQDLPIADRMLYIVSIYWYISKQPSFKAPIYAGSKHWFSRGHRYNFWIENLDMSSFGPR